MSWEIVVALFSGAFGASLVNLFIFLIKRKDDKDGQNDDVVASITDLKTDFDS